MKIGLALAGGGVSGSAAIGVIRALEEAGVQITHIAGTSSGAMVAALYAYGYSVDQLIEIVPRLNRQHLDIDWKGILLKLIRYKPYLDGCLKGYRLQELLLQLTNHEEVSAFQIPCGIVATDLAEGKPVVFSNQAIAGYTTLSDVSIADAVRASCGIPVIFQPLRIREFVLADGGVLINCPVHLVKQMGALHVISVDPVAPFVKNRKGALTTFRSIFFHVVNLTLQAQMQREHTYAMFTLHPNVGSVGALDFKKVMHCIEVGYRHTKLHLPDILRLLET
ncbi:patatin-like phospholipase family protein [Fodinisporobacter ferrooxydans]|uniref:Patatin-like phospholipase family protein n=1 Tax=Fodinisporobacter ferrooxydans TaxID=2901836 RepID=A0ABY4CJC1_9BACL|nr:patatin-like phospholipase family protein [Alicyclobacillaceae bacterium MYW30-H2]